MADRMEHGGGLSTWWLLLRLVGAVLIAASVVVLLEAFVRFVVEGVGTPPRASYGYATPLRATAQR